mmetsp:Transcript_25159/g.63830  ORF Transcript_25159/g.63830 Transcript_25159/m.63830 type:complete len:260 (-) Transcript_25159:1316-2095(-)
MGEDPQRLRHEEQLRTAEEERVHHVPRLGQQDRGPVQGRLRSLHSQGRGGRQDQPGWHEGWLLRQADSAGRRPGHVALEAEQGRHRGALCGLRRHLRDAQGRGGHLLRDIAGGRVRGGPQADPAPGAGRHDLEQAVLLLRHPRLLRRRLRLPDAGRRAALDPQQRLGPHGQQRHHLHAGQVGVPVVRDLGPGLPLRAAGPGGRPLREGTAPPDDKGVVHASKRAATRVRVELQRCQPAGARLGRVARVPDGPQIPRRRR